MWHGAEQRKIVERQFIYEFGYVIMSLSTYGSYCNTRQAICITKHRSAFAKSLLPWKSNKYYIFVCVRGCVCVHVWVGARGRGACECALVAIPTMSSAASMAPPHFSTLSDKRHDFREKVIEHKMYILIFLYTLIWNILHSKNNSGRCHKCEKVFM